MNTDPLLPLIYHIEATYKVLQLGLGRNGLTGLWTFWSPLHSVGGFPTTEFSDENGGLSCVMNGQSKDWTGPVADALLNGPYKDELCSPRIWARVRSIHLKVNEVSCNSRSVSTNCLIFLFDRSPFDTLPSGTHFRKKVREKVDTGFWSSKEYSPVLSLISIIAGGMEKRRTSSKNDIFSFTPRVRTFEFQGPLNNNNVPLFAGLMRPDERGIKGVRSAALHKWTIRERGSAMTECGATKPYGYTHVIPVPQPRS
ncbi:hypothetical protein EDD18DRAFT_1333276 [Armillaria luteobubalina]|uniref:Uncharacterized protein n=1 Tax=Armillaria luteobubalina TaxID=153913 RepID=A0AA39TLT8_9AGAR|nr:hypothetical protein EDD18DRAFT_1333276 [Armillaria luteobubalina]